MNLPLRASLLALLLVAPAAGGDRLVRLPDGRMLAFTCAGRGPVTVVLEAGWAADARAWGRVVPLIAARTRVCAYDRAGAGRSAPGPMPRDGPAIARDLADALAALGVDGPVLPVGHSTGGLYVRHLAALLPGRIAGMVLADPTVAERASQFGPIVERSRKCREAFQMAPGSEGETRPPECAVRPPADGAAAWEARLSEIETILLLPPPLPEVPLIVLAAVKGLDGPASDIRRGQLAAVARQSPRGELRVLADSGHMVMRDRPDAVAEAVFAILASRDSQVTPSALPPKPAGKGEMP